MPKDQFATHVAAYDRYVSDLAMSCYRLGFKLAWDFCKNRPQLRSHLDDLVSVAHLGIVNAARKFDPAVGVKFVTYAQNGAVFNLIREVDTISRHGFRGLDRDKREFAQVVDVQTGDGFVRLIDMIPAREVEPDDEKDIANRRWIASAMQDLTPVQRRSISLRYLRGLTLKECGEVMDKTREAVRQSCAKGLERMRRRAS